MTTEQVERREFEDWYKASMAPAEADWFKRDPEDTNEYFHASTLCAWEGWQARAALVQHDSLAKTIEDLLVLAKIQGARNASNALIDEALSLIRTRRVVAA